MTDMLLAVTGEDTTGTSMFIYYLNPGTGVYTLLGRRLTLRPQTRLRQVQVVHLCFHTLLSSIFRLPLAVTLVTSWFSTRAAQ